MSTDTEALIEEGAPRYLQGGDPALADYVPAWLDDIAEDATVEGSMLKGAVPGADAVRTIVGTIRQLYGDTQGFHFAGPWHDDIWIEDYIARIDGMPLGCLVLVSRNSAGQTTKVVASYRPIETVIHFSHLLHGKLAKTPYAKWFLADDEF